MKTLEELPWTKEGGIATDACNYCRLAVYLHSPQNSVRTSQCTPIVPQKQAVNPVEEKMSVAVMRNAVFGYNVGILCVDVSGTYSYRYTLNN
jgi:hypothetical protein